MKKPQFRKPELRLKKITGLEKRWLLNNVSIMVVLVLLCVLLVTLSMASYYYTSVRASLETKAKTTGSFFAGYSDRDYSEFYQTCIRLSQTYDEGEGVELQFISPAGELLASSDGQRPGAMVSSTDVTEALQNGRTASFSGADGQTGQRVMAVSSPLLYADGAVVGVLRYIASLETVDRQVMRIAALSVLVGLVFVALIFFVSSYFIRSILDPLSQITATAKRIAAGSYGVQIPKRYDDEIGELADTINDMSLKISRSEKTQSEFISSVSHELRTPLTAISGWSETLLSAENLDPEVRRGMLIILREARRLTGMVEELLEFTRMQNGRFTLRVEKSDILAEFEDTVFMYGSRLRQEGITLNYTAPDASIGEIPCDVARMRQVFLNVLDNAAKHGGDGKKIDASIAKEDSSVVIRIRDYGVGIPEEELPHVKMKFYKGSSKARGSGIGLAVCEEIVTMHGGSLTLENAAGGGTLVTISIPAGEE